MSSLVMHAEKMNSGSLVWKEHSQKVWVLVEVLSQENTMLRVRHKATREEEEVDLVRHVMARNLCVAMRDDDTLYGCQSTIMGMIMV